MDQWSALIDLKKNGKLKSIGASNYGILHINEIEESGLILPDANQIEFHIWSQKPKLIKFLNSSIYLILCQEFENRTLKRKGLVRKRLGV